MLLHMQLLRVFHDRLISEEDKTIFKGKVEELVQARWVHRRCVEAQLDIKCTSTGRCLGCSSLAGQSGSG